MSLSPKVARRDTSIKTSIPHTRTLKEIFENGQQGNIDDASLARESLSILNLHEKSICEMDSNSHISMYEMYFPFIRGHYSANASDMPKTKLYTWIKKVRWYIHFAILSQKGTFFPGAGILILCIN